MRIHTGVYTFIWGSPEIPRRILAAQLHPLIGMVDKVHLHRHVQLLQAMPQHLCPRVAVGLAHLEAPLDRDLAGRLL